MPMRNSPRIALLVLAGLVLPGLLHAAPWAKFYGGPDQEFPARVTPGAAGASFLLAGTRSYGAGETDALFAKLDASGAVEWAKALGGKGNDILTVEPMADGGYFVGGHTASFGAGNPAATNFNVLFAKFDSSWRTVSQKVWGGARDELAEFSRTADGGFLFRGSSASFTSAGDVRDVLLIKISSAGEMVWRKVYHVGNDDAYGSTIELADGYVLSFGTLEGDAVLLKVGKATGTLLWKKKLHAPAFLGIPKLAKTLDGSVLAASSLATGFDSRIVLLKVAGGDGSISWKRSYGHPTAGVLPVSVAEKPDATLVLAGTLLEPSGTNFIASSLVMNLSTSGAVRVQTKLQVAGRHLTADVALAGKLWYGVSFDPVKTNFDAVVARLGKSTFEPVWAKTFGGRNPESGIAFKQGTRFLFSGHTESLGGASPGKGNVYAMTLEAATGDSPDALATLGLEHSPAGLTTFTPSIQATSAFLLTSRNTPAAASTSLQIKTITLDSN